MKMAILSGVPFFSGAHLSFLFDLYTLKTKEPSSFANFLSLVDHRGVNLIDRIRWKKVNVSSHSVEVKSGGRLVKKDRQRILIIPTVRIGDDDLSFNQLSEGTFRTLAMLFYIMTDKSLVFVD